MCEASYPPLNPAALKNRHHLLRIQTSATSPTASIFDDAATSMPPVSSPSPPTPDPDLGDFTDCIDLRQRCDQHAACVFPVTVDTNPHVQLSNSFYFGHDNNHLDKLVEASTNLHIDFGCSSDDPATQAIAGLDPAYTRKRRSRSKRVAAVDFNLRFNLRSGILRRLEEKKDVAGMMRRIWAGLDRSSAIRQIRGGEA